MTVLRRPPSLWVVKEVACLTTLGTVSTRLREFYEVYFVVFRELLSKRKNFPAAQEGVREDIERAFGALPLRFQIRSGTCWLHDRHARMFGFVRQDCWGTERHTRKWDRRSATFQPDFRWKVVFRCFSPRSALQEKHLGNSLPTLPSYVPSRGDKDQLL